MEPHEALSRIYLSLFTVKELMTHRKEPKCSQPKAMAKMEEGLWERRDHGDPDREDEEEAGFASVPEE